ncbi:hypothetical protein lerEdw1_009682 [Lerista edwardsae]|nr:hypothetical protein lerEdw1_009682 [Lerista edwardsae]
MMTDVENLAEPKDIEGIMEEGVVLIKAWVPSHATRFSVDLASSDNSIPFHFSAQFFDAPPVAACKMSYTYKSGKKERTFKLPVRWGESFEMTIVAGIACYEVSVNGEHLLNVEHRFPCHALKGLQVRGHIIVEEARCPPDKVSSSKKATPQRPQPADSGKRAETRIDFVDDPV